MRHVLAISIGPVQGFIAAARSTRDLWAGSELLSECARSAAKAVQDAGGDLVFPASLEPGSPVANKLVALVDDPDECATNARNAAVEHVRKQAKLVEKHAGAAIDALSYWAQIDTFIEFYAAWHPIDGFDYKTARANAERLLAGSKALRRFAQAPAGMSGSPKSSLDGGRDSVLAGKLDKQARAKLRLKEAEQLDALSLVKRNADPQKFVSTARVAADPWIRRLERENPEYLLSLADLAESLVDNAEYDVVRLTKDRFPNYQTFPYDTELLFAGQTGAASEAEKEFAARIKSFRRGQPSPYFAILAADGDRMGAMISGIDDVAHHCKLSANLSEFAQSVREIVCNHHGALVYCGGDDLLAFLPLDTAIACATMLQAEFRTKLKPFKDDASISAGLAIVHFLSPLDRALAWARDAEKAAKKARSSLAVSLHTRSSGAQQITVADLWSADPDRLYLACTDALSKGALSRNAIYKLRGLADEFDRVQDQTGAALASEAVQALRHSEKRGGGAVGDSVINELLAPAADGGEIGDLDSPPQFDAEKLRKVVNRLIICRRMALASEAIQALRHSEKRGGGAVADSVINELLAPAADGGEIGDLDSPPQFDAEKLRKVVNRLIICRRMARASDDPDDGVAPGTEGQP